MSSKAELIAKLLEMQKHFIEFEHKNGVKFDDYYNPPKGHVFDNYVKEYNEIALKINEMAHQEAGSSR